MDKSIAELTAYATTPLALVTLTLLAHFGGSCLHRASGRSVLVNPLLVAVAIVSGVLITLDTPYAVYSEATTPIHFFLGPAIVALAVPLYRRLDRIRENPGAILLGIALGSCCAIGVAVGIVCALGASSLVVASMAPKSVTTPVAMAVAAEIGGLPSLTAVIVVTTGIVGYALGPPILDAIGVRDPISRGLAYGTAAHIMGTAKAAQEGEEAAAVSGLAMALNAMATAIMLPLVWPRLGPLVL